MAISREDEKTLRELEQNPFTTQAALKAQADNVFSAKMPNEIGSTTLSPQHLTNIEYSKDLVYRWLDQISDDEDVKTMTLLNAYTGLGTIIFEAAPSNTHKTYFLRTMSTAVKLLALVGELSILSDILNPTNPANPTNPKPKEK